MSGPPGCSTRLGWAVMSHPNPGTLCPQVAASQVPAPLAALPGHMAGEGGEPHRMCCRGRARGHSTAHSPLASAPGHGLHLPAREAGNAGQEDTWPATPRPPTPRPPPHLIPPPPPPPLSPARRQGGSAAFGTGAGECQGRSRDGQAVECDPGGMQRKRENGHTTHSSQEVLRNSRRMTRD